RGVRRRLPEQFLDGLRADAGLEAVAVLFAQLAVLGFGEALLLLHALGVAGVRADVGRKVDHPLQRPRRHVQHQAGPAGHAFEVPDVADGGGQLDVAHTLPAHLGAGHLDPAAVTDDPLEANPLVLAAVALPVLRGPEDALTEQP